MRRTALGMVLLASSALSGQQPGLSRADSALVARILTAEDRRDSGSTAFGEGLRHPDARIQLLAKRARARVGDPRFAARDSLPPLPPPPHYDDPAWRIRYRALNAKAPDCGLIARALADSAWPVRLRAIDVSPACASDTGIVGTVRRWAQNPPGSSRRGAVYAGWHPAAHAIVALAGLEPSRARTLLPAYASSRVPWLRSYAARAAAALSDTALLRRLALDANDNVREAAVDALAKTAGHAADDVYLQVIFSGGPQAVRAAALALKGSDRLRAAAPNLQSVLNRWRSSGNETARDVRVALADRLKEAGIGASSDLATPPASRPLPAQAVALALGEDVRLRVTMADSSGGGSFVVRLRGDVAPIIAARIVELVNAHWYDGRTWYRVEPDFVIQGGGPGSNEYAGHPRFLRDELASVPHVRGTVGMSTRGHDTGDAQWFINLRDNQRLTRDYTLFGEIIEGIDVVDGILEGDVIKRVEVIGPATARRP